MRLIIEYGIGDGCTYGCTETVPVEYESAEAFAVDFEQLCNENKRNHQTFLFAGNFWHASNHLSRYDAKTNECPYDAPDIFTVDEWFKYHGVE